MSNFVAPPMIQPNAQFQSQVWLGLRNSKPEVRHQSNYEHESVYQLTDAIVGVSAWNHGLASWTNGKVINKIRENICRSLYRLLDDRRSCNSIFVDWNTGRHESGCIERDGLPGVVSQLFDQITDGEAAYANASCFSACIDDPVNMFNPTLTIHPVFHRYGSWVGRRPHLWWRRYGAVDVDVKVSWWTDSSPNCFSQTGAPPWSRHPKHLAEWTQLTVFMAHCQNDWGADGYGWNPIAEKRQRLTRHIPVEVFFVTLGAILDEFEECPHPNAIAFISSGDVDAMAARRYINTHAIWCGHDGRPHTFYGKGPDFVLIHRGNVGEHHRGECRTREVCHDAVHPMLEVTFRLAFLYKRELSELSSHEILYESFSESSDEMVVEEWPHDVPEGGLFGRPHSLSGPPSPWSTSGDGYIVNPIGKPVAFFLPLQKFDTQSTYPTRL